MKANVKIVELNGVKYKITFQPFAYSDSRFVVNGEASSKYISNCALTNLEAFKEYAKEAIEEYCNRKVAQRNFDSWDGKL